MEAKIDIIFTNIVKYMILNGLTLITFSLVVGIYWEDNNLQFTVAALYWDKVISKQISLQLSAV